MKFRKIIILVLSLLFIISLTSCSNNKRNQVTPYGTIDTNQIVVNSNDNSVSLSNKEVYDRLKYSYGYDVFSNWYNYTLYQDELNTVITDTATYQALIYRDMLYEVYGVSSMSSLLRYTVTGDTNIDAEKTTLISKYIDTMSQKGFTSLTQGMFNAFTLTDNNHLIDTSSVKVLTTDPLYKYYALKYAKELAQTNYILSNIDNKVIPNPTNPDIQQKNSYYADEKTLETFYNDTYKYYSTVNAIIIKFSTLADQKLWESKASMTGTTVDDALKVFNAFYSYNPLSSSVDIGTDPRTIFVTSDTRTDLNDISSTLKNKILDGDMKLNQYYSLSVDSAFYSVCVTGITYTASNNSTLLKYSELNQTQKDAVKKAYAYTNASNVATDVNNKRVYESNTVINDPFIEYSFGSNYSSFYKYLETNVASNDNTLVSMTINGSIYTYSIDKFYDDLKNYNINSTISTLLVSKYMYQNYKNNTTYLSDYSSTLKDLRNTIKADLKSFNKNKESINKGYGASTFLFYKYGFYSQTDYEEYSIAQTIISNFTSKYVYNSWATSNSYEAMMTLLNTTGLNIYKSTTNVNMNISHFLISVDYDGDGQQDDMNVFMSTLQPTELTNFQNALVAFADAVQKKFNQLAPYYSSDDILNEIVREYNDPSNGTFTQYKKYNFTVKTEDLGDVTNSSITSYVKPFQTYLQELNKKVLTDSPTIDENKGILYTATKGDMGTNGSTYAYDDLCITQYGAHMIVVNSYEKDINQSLSFKYTEDQDTTGTYKDIKVVLDENDTTDDTSDDIIKIIPDIYNNDDAIPTVNQAFVYYVNVINGTSITLPTDLQTSIGDILSTVIDKYKNSSYQSYLLAMYVNSTLGITSTLQQYNFNTYATYLMNTIESYDQTSLKNFETWYTIDSVNTFINARK